MAEKKLFHSEGGNLFELLQTGGGPDYKSYTIELFSKQNNKWIKTGIYFKTPFDLSIDNLMNEAKEKVEQSIFA